MTRNVAKESLLGLLAIFTKVNIKTMSEMAMVRCAGLMEVTILVHGFEVYSMAMGKLSFLMDQKKRAILRIICTSDLSQEKRRHLS